MPRYLQNPDGRLAGSVGDGRDTVPSAPASGPRAPAPSAAEPVPSLAAVLAVLQPQVPALLSPSSVNTYRKCPKLFYFEKVLRMRSPGTAATVKGTLAHKVLEDIWALPADERTPQAAAALADRHWAQMAAEPETRGWLDADPKHESDADLLEHAKQMLAGYFDLEDTSGRGTVDIPFFGEVSGQEMHVAARIGGGEFQGFIDRLDTVRDPATGDHAFRVADYKGLAVDTPLATPGGWTTMGLVRVGDEVFGRDGTPTRVLGKSQVKLLPCYRITFDDATSVVCDEEHLWEVSTGDRAPRAQVVPVGRIAGMLARRNGRSTAVWVDRQQPLDLPDADLPIDPYVLGVWLGDGHSNSSEVFVATRLAGELRAELTACGETVSDSTCPSSADGLCSLTSTTTREDLCQRGHERYASRLRGGGRVARGDCRRAGCSRSGDRVRFGPLRARLRHEGLLGNKHVPAAYLRGSYAQRLALLQGLMDTDGSWNTGRAQAVFTSVNPHLAAAVEELVRSLGSRATRAERDYTRHDGLARTAVQVMFTPVGFMPFRMPTRAAKVAQRSLVKSVRRYVRSVEPVEPVPTQCIQVAAADSMYLAGRQMVPTHNTGKLPKRPEYLDDYWFQQMTYASLLRQKYGINVAVIRLVFLQGKVYERAVTGADIDAHDALLSDAHSAVQRSADDDHWPGKPAFLCNWCHFRDECADYQQSRFPALHARMR